MEVQWTVSVLPFVDSCQRDLKSTVDYLAILKWQRMGEYFIAVFFIAYSEVLRLSNITAMF